MIKQIFVFVVLAIFFVACNNSQSAVQFNDKLVKIEKSLVDPLQREEANASKYFEEGKLDSIHAVGSRLERLIQSKIEEVKAVKTPDIPQAENFKKSYLKAYKVAKDVYALYKAYGLSKSDEERQELIEKVKELMQENQTATNDMLAAQRIFATANNIKLK
jgi:hypothetical protein